MNNNVENPKIINKKIHIDVGDISLRGKLYIPGNINDSKGIIIFTHGLGYCDRQYSLKGEAFAENGYLFLTYNLRGHAGTKGEWTLSGSVADLCNIIDYLIKEYNFSQNHRVCVMGHSTGALISLLAGMRDDRIKFGSVVTPVTCLTDSYLHWFKSGFNQDVKEVFKTKGILPKIIEDFMDDPNMLKQYRDGELDQDKLSISHRYGLLKSSSWDNFFGEIAKSPDVLDLTEKISMPLLLFRGLYDEIMDVQKTNILYEKIKSDGKSKLFLTKSKNHFHNDSWDMIQSITMEFFDDFCSQNPPAQIEKKFILIVDDEVLITKTLLHLLKRNGFCNVFVANSGEQALHQIKDLKENKKRDFDLVISDIRMPGLDGIETIKSVQAMVSSWHGKQSSVMFITGYAGEKERLEAKALGFVDCFYKPLDNNEFLKSIRKCLS